MSTAEDYRSVRLSPGAYDKPQSYESYISSYCEQTLVVGLCPTPFVR